jgi:hypothetical protein
MLRCAVQAPGLERSAILLPHNLIMGEGNSCLASRSETEGGRANQYSTPGEWIVRNLDGRLMVRHGTGDRMDIVQGDFRRQVQDLKQHVLECGDSDN